MTKAEAIALLDLMRQEPPRAPELDQRTIAKAYVAVREGVRPWACENASSWSSPRRLDARAKS